MAEFEKLVYQLYLSYYQARKNKRNTYNQLDFEFDYESNIIQLAKDIDNREYNIKPSIAFMVNKPVAREIFAADFSDRVVHHLIYKLIYDYIEKKFIFDSYSCRKNKGNLFGIKRAKKFIRSCSDNYTKNCYILKLDIKGYFMSINHNILYDKVIKSLDKNIEYNGISFSTIDYLLKKVIFNDVVSNCKIKGKKSEWNILPRDKSLFNIKKGVGLAIGNLTSQLFGNLYLDELDQYIKKDLKVKYYGRYVDDMIFIHKDKEYLKNIIQKVQDKIKIIGLKIHPKKIYLQPYNNGVLFLGQYIKPQRSYISNRVKNNFYKTLHNINKLITKTETIDWSVMVIIRSKLNSYLGMLKHSNSYRLVKKAISILIKRFYLFFRFNTNFTKVSINKDFWQWHYLLTYRSTN